MDAYYAQVEMKRHNLPEDTLLGVVQWESLIAISYPAKARGVKRQMNVYDALMKVGLDIKFAHVDTISNNEGIG